MVRNIYPADNDSSYPFFFYLYSFIPLFIYPSASFINRQTTAYGPDGYVYSLVDICMILFFLSQLALTSGDQVLFVWHINMFTHHFILSYLFNFFVFIFSSLPLEHFFFLQMTNQ